MIPPRIIRATTVVALALLAAACTGPTGPQAADGDVRPTSVAGPALPDAVSREPMDPGLQANAAPSTPAAAATLAVAEAFVVAWARPALHPVAWLAGVRPYVTDDYAAMLSTVDPSNVPARVVTGPATVVSSNTAVAVFDVPTDAGGMRVTCVLRGDGWRVSTLRPVSR